mmetsp:Transcript_130493/g.260393  ORF Transcript_130493/g.260393 Transcript_130493/m.260393 type:complete len:106 (+) Transcript_130493:84-401(+)
MSAVGTVAQLAYKLVTVPQATPQAFCNVIKLGTFCRTVVWPILPSLAFYQYIRRTDIDYFTLEVLYYKSGSKDYKAFYDTSRVGGSGHWRLQQDLEAIRAAANPE